MKINKQNFRLVILALATLFSCYTGFAQDDGTEQPNDRPHNEEEGNEGSRYVYDVKLPESYDTLLCLVQVSESDSVLIPFVNFGSATLTGLNYTFELNNQTIGPLYWSGNVATDEVGFLSIPPFLNSTPGQITFTVFTENPNGATDENPTNDTSEVTVILGEVPQLPFTSVHSEICANDTLELGSNLPAAYSFYWQQFQDSARIQSVSDAGTYSVQAISQDGCSTDAQYMIDELPSPDPNWVDRDTFCLNESPQIEVSSEFTSFAWQGSGTVLNDSTFAPASSGPVSLQVVDSNNCTFSFDTLIQVSDQPGISYPRNEEFCEGDFALIKPAIAQSNSQLSFNWSDGNTSYSRKVGTPGIYKVTISNEYGCTKTDTVSVIENALPVTDIVGPDVFCSGEQIVVALNKIFTGYKWNTGNKSRTQTIDKGGLYTITVTDKNNCENIAEVFIEELKPRFDLGSDTVLCLGDALLVDLEDAGSDFSWSDGSRSSKRFISEPGEYSVTVTDSMCVFIDEFNVDEIQKPEVDFEFVAEDFSVYFNNTSINADSFLWTFKSGVFSNSENPVYVFSEIGSYNVRLQGFNVCGVESLTKGVSVGSISVLEHEIFDEFSLFPNPVLSDRVLNVSFSGYKGSQVYFRVHNSLGQLMMQERHSVSGEAAQLKLNLNHLAAGNYFITVSNPDESDRHETKQFVITK